MCFSEIRNFVLLDVSVFSFNSSICLFWDFIYSLIDWLIDWSAGCSAVFIEYLLPWCFRPASPGRKLAAHEAKDFRPIQQSPHGNKPKEKSGNNEHGSLRSFNLIGYRGCDSHLDQLKVIVYYDVFRIRLQSFSQNCLFRAAGWWGGNCDHDEHANSGTRSGGSHVNVQDPSEQES